MVQEDTYGIAGEQSGVDGNDALMEQKMINEGGHIFYGSQTGNQC